MFFAVALLRFRNDSEPEAVSTKPCTEKINKQLFYLLCLLLDKDDGFIRHILLGNVKALDILAWWACVFSTENQLSSY